MTRRWTARPTAAVVALFALGAVFMAAVDRGAVLALKSQFPLAAPIYFELCVLPPVTAAQSPVTSKLLPALGLLLVAGRYRGWGRDLRGRPIRYAALGGLSVGVAGLLIESVVVAPGAGLGPASLPQVGVHLVTGTLVGTAVFRPPGSRWRRVGIVVLVLVVSAGVQYLWATRLAPQLVGQLTCG